MVVGSTNDRLSLLRGRSTWVDAYQAAQPRRGRPPRLPSLEPNAHSAKLLSQLDAIRATANARSEPVRANLPLARSSLFIGSPGADLAPNLLDPAQEAWLVRVVPKTGVVPHDVASATLGSPIATPRNRDQ